MGTPPASMYATLYFAIHEHHILPSFLRELVDYGCYIDSGFGIWIPDPTLSDVDNNAHWLSFQHAINNYRQSSHNQ
jgi:hypothetical protein